MSYASALHLQCKVLDLKMCHDIVCGYLQIYNDSLFVNLFHSRGIRVFRASVTMFHFPKKWMDLS